MSKSILKLVRITKIHLDHSELYIVRGYSHSESENDRRTIKKDQMISDKHQRKFLLSLSLGMNGPYRTFTPHGTGTESGTGNNGCRKIMQDQEWDQDPLFLIVLFPLQVPVPFPFPCSVNVPLKVRGEG